ncbi:MAG: methyltransferase domain-containing protein [Alphaproteobacteria bacterium]|nr:methyltransferase domain-containing protein [Alphaproteobacteria bacterium]
MRLGGRLSAAIAVLGDFEARRAPLKTCLADWARGARYAGAKDRAFISGLCLDVLRRRSSLSLVVCEGEAAPRGLVLAAIAGLWRVDLAELEEACRDEHGPGALTDDERVRLAGAASAIDASSALDAPEWCASQLRRAFGEATGEEARALSARADIDLRINSLKSTPAKALAALKSVKGTALPVLTTAARIAAPDPSEKAPAITVIPAFNKGWVEVQDLGSQIASAAAGNVTGAQVLDYCAGSGGKTLALAALMGNKGQLYAYDIDARRLAPAFHRAARAGVRNLQIRSPAEGAGLEDLVGRMDVVFVDAPCTGSGTWRRHPDAKWRLTERQFASRIEEQDQVLAAAAGYVRPGGRLVYVTCSVFLEENDDRVEAFLGREVGFARAPALEAVAASGILTADGREALSACETSAGDLRLTPARIGSDGFYVSVLARRSS